MKKAVAAILAMIVLLPTSVFAHEEIACSDWASEHVSKAYDIGFLDGLELEWSSDITREQFCVLAYAMLDSVSDKAWITTKNIPFSDTYNERITALFCAGIIKGKAESIFAPNDPLTREEAATILGRMADYLGFSRTMMLYLFADADDISSWAADGVQTVCNLGIMKGVGDNRFDPKGKYTAEQAVTTVMRMYDHRVSMMFSSLSFSDRLNSKMPDSENFVFSPLSIKLALLLAANGAKDATLDQILGAVDVENLATYNEKVKELLASYSQSELLKLDVSNSLWINTDMSSATQFSDEYENKVRTFYEATVDTVTRDSALAKINGWVNKKTNGKIPSVITSEDVEFWTMIVNAVYFNGRWQNEFSPGSTKPGSFTSKDGSVADVDFMNRTSWMPYADVLGVQIVELPYLTREDKLDADGNYIGTLKLDDVDISMYLMMSDYVFHPVYILEKADFSSKYVALSVPKFKVEYSTNLNDTLKSLGIVNAFSPVADFSGMYDNGIWTSITKVMHKTYISINEEGTEAAAVTAVGMAGTALPPKPVSLRFNKPFTFVIKDNINNEILFMGDFSYAK